MKKVCLGFVLVLVLAFAGFAEIPKLKVSPKLYWSTAPLLVVNPKTDRWGLTVLGFDGSLFQCGNFCFPALGIGLQIYQKETVGWHVYTDYQGYQRQYYGEGYELFFEPYLKITPVKYRWAWASKVLKLDSYLELGLAVNPLKAKKDILVTLGLSFSGNPFKKKKK